MNILKRSSFAVLLFAGMQVFAQKPVQNIVVQAGQKKIAEDSMILSVSQEMMDNP